MLKIFFFVAALAFVTPAFAAGPMFAGPGGPTLDNVQTAIDGANRKLERLRSQREALDRDIDDQYRQIDFLKGRLEAAKAQKQ